MGGMPHGLTRLSPLVIKPRTRHRQPTQPVTRRGSMDDAEPQTTYRHLLDLWTSGVRDYHSLLSDYLAANSIFVAAIGFLLARQPLTLIFTLLVIILCLFGVLMTFQMAIVLGC